MTNINARSIFQMPFCHATHVVVFTQRDHITQVAPVLLKHILFRHVTVYFDCSLLYPVM